MLVLLTFISEANVKSFKKIDDKIVNFEKENLIISHKRLEKYQ